ncbi:hypothetical protein VIGAN_09117900 [Vigna angularis var. angularis]|uniref:Uncharacterized protein n=1 Tax=Vigna angularis var. angularis TaxID=157739 RepID=A0A0S3SXX6_PHAAN|nr:hypothetical protein VIGAN_09117900 [Vigna angularis var. angularis]
MKGNSTPHFLLLLKRDSTQDQELLSPKLQKDRRVYIKMQKIKWKMESQFKEGNKHQLFIHQEHVSSSLKEKHSKYKETKQSKRNKLAAS